MVQTPETGVNKEKRVEVARRGKPINRADLFVAVHNRMLKKSTILRQGYEWQASGVLGRSASRSEVGGQRSAAVDFFPECQTSGIQATDQSVVQRDPVHGSPISDFRPLVGSLGPWLAPP